MNEKDMHELAAAMGYEVWLSYPNFTQAYQIVLITYDQRGKDGRIHILAELKSVEETINWLLLH